MAFLVLQPLIWPILLLILVGTSVFLGMYQNAQSLKQVNLAQQRLQLLVQLASDLSSMESGERGFVISGQESFLQPYVLNKASFIQHTGQLLALSSISLQRQNTQKLINLVDVWDRTAAQPEIRARQSSQAAATALVSDGSGLFKMEQARELLRVMNQNENVRLSRALNRNEQIFRLVRNLTLGGLGLGMVLLLLAAQRTVRLVNSTLSQLQAETRQITAGQYGLPLAPTGVRELDALAQQVQQMAQAVQQRELQLRGTSELLEQTNQQLRRSNRELERFAYVASHDLQEPLRTIASYTELLRKRYRGQLDARAEKYMDFTVEATHRLKKLIQDLLAFSRLQRGERPFELVDTAVLVGDVLDELAAYIQRAGAVILVGTPPTDRSLEAAVRSDLPTVTGNVELLHHIFLNLLNNALKFRDSERTLELRLWATQKRDEQDTIEWIFHVQDNGIGIEPQYHQKIFEAFQRLHKAETFEGSGIGLAVTRYAVEQHGGQIWLESTPGVGTTFHFSVKEQAGLRD